MIWLTLVRRFWPHMLAAGAVIGVGWYLRQAGYEAGYAAREAYWRPKFEAAAGAKAKADARADALEAASNALSDQSEKRYAETMASLASRAADADKRIRDLSMRLSAARASRGEVCPVSGTTAIPDGAPESSRRADEAGGRIAAVGAACESDAAQLAELQNWIRDQAAILR